MIKITYCKNKFKELTLFCDVEQPNENVGSVLIGCHIVIASNLNLVRGFLNDPLIKRLAVIHDL